MQKGCLYREGTLSLSVFLLPSGDLQFALHLQADHPHPTHELIYDSHLGFIVMVIVTGSFGPSPVSDSLAVSVSLGVADF